MKTIINEDKIMARFLKTLSSSGISKTTLKNYRSDISHFCAWLILKVRSLGVFAETFSDTIPFLKRNFGFSYKSFLSENNIPAQTVNRRLSTLRNFSRFLLENQILDFDLSYGVRNITLRTNKSSLSPLISEFQEHLRKEKVSDNTIKNYLSDIRQFISWVERAQSVSGK